MSKQPQSAFTDSFIPPIANRSDRVDRLSWSITRFIDVLATAIALGLYFVLPWKFWIVAIMLVSFMGMRAIRQFVAIAGIVGTMTMRNPWLSFGSKIASIPITSVRTFLSGMMPLQVLDRARAIGCEIEELQRYIEIAGRLSPAIQRTVRAFALRHHVEDARMYLNKEIVAHNRTVDRREVLLREAASARCLETVRSHVDRGDLTAAESVIRIARAVAADAVSLGIASLVAPLIETGDFEAAVECCVHKQRILKREKIMDELRTRVERARPEYHASLKRLLLAVEATEIDSRDYRIARHVLEKELEHAT